MLQQISTRISAVTVYTDQALLTRQGSLELTGQERGLIVADLPATLQPQSIRVKGSGTVAVRLLGVRTEHVYAPEPIVVRDVQLAEQIDQVRRQQEQVKQELALLQRQCQFVQELMGEKSSDRFSRALSMQRMTLDQTGDLLDFVGQRYRELTGAIAQQEQARRQLDKQLTALFEQLNQVETPHAKESYTLIIGLLPTGPGEFELEVSYTVNWASWQPLYDLQVDTQKGELHLDYLAEVTQNTGEDWSDVALTLSTAKPGLGALPPKLSPWYIDIPAPPRMASPASISMERRGRGRDFSAVSADSLEDFSAVSADSLELVDELDFTLGLSEVLEPTTAPTYTAQAIGAQVSREGSVVTFQIDGNNNIPSDGTPQKITVFGENYPCRLAYVAIPKLVSFAYLQALVTNPATGATLLPGAANIFRDSTFVGTTCLQNVAPNQEFKLNLGIDEGLQIQRELIERKVDKRLMQDKRLITYGYRLVVRNLGDRETTLTLTEQLPVSRNEQIKVRLTRSHPQIQLGEMGILEWQIPLKPLAKQEVTYQFTVEVPRDLQVIGLDL
jgi:hypothetical protein